MGEEFDATVPCYKLTTVDNPFNPVTERDDWKHFDDDHGYGTEEYVARVSDTAIYLTDAENQRAENKAIDDIIRINRKLGINIYKKVFIP